MNEKDLKILDWYELQIKNICRGRGAYICQTEQGNFLLKEYQGSVQKAEFIQEICLRLKDGKKMGVDYFLRNKDGELVTRDKEDNVFVVKAWTTGRECNVRDIAEIIQTVNNLAEVHNVLQSVCVRESMEVPTQYDEYTKHLKELKKIRTYIREKKRKTSFELYFLKYYQEFRRQGENALICVQDEYADELLRKSCRRGCICHGDYNQHNVFLEEKNVFTANFDKCHCGIQMEDLYHFMRKILEKHNWDLDLAKQMLEAYDRKNPLQKEECKDLYARFLFPEKFWKIANYYYNSRKSWISERSTGKLEKIVCQSEEKNKFLNYLFGISRF